jgi:hypothetical protein
VWGLLCERLYDNDCLESNRCLTYRLVGKVDSGIVVYLFAGIGAYNVLCDEKKCDLTYYSLLLGTSTTSHPGPPPSASTPLSTIGFSPPLIQIRHPPRLSPLADGKWRPSPTNVSSAASHALACSARIPSPFCQSRRIQIPEATQIEGWHQKKR